MLSDLVEVGAEQEPVDDDQLAQLGLRARREDGRQPDHRLLAFVFLTEPRQAVEVFVGGMTFGVEGEVDDELPFLIRPQR